MFSQFFISILPHPTFLIFVATFAGALAGECYRETTDNIPYTLVRFLAKFFASWMLGFAVTLLIQGSFSIGKSEMLAAISIFFGFVGHEESINFARKIINSKFDSKK